jgi:hypothetical protein
MGAAAPLLMLGLTAQGVNAQTHTIIRNQPPPPCCTGGGGSATEGPPANNSSCLAPKYPTGQTIGQLNYIIYNQCKAIEDLHLRFEVTDELTAKHDNEVNNCNPSKVTKTLNTTEGIYIQFNAFSKDAPNAMIQYIFAVTGNEITPHIQYSGGTPDNKDHDWLQSYDNPYGLRLATANSLAKGFVLEVDLSTNDQGYVNGAKFTVTEPNGSKHEQKAPESGLFPVRISEFQTNVVSTNGHYVDFAKDGAGTLSYSSKGELAVEGGDIEHCAAAFGDYDGGTCETSNASYSCVATSGAALTQSVTVK